MRVVWSPLALDRVTEIARYIAQDRPLAAEKWVRTVFSKAGQLEDSPRLGRIVPEIGNEDFRELIHANYRIIYRIEESRVAILTVRHGRQCLPLEEIEG